MKLARTCTKPYVFRGCDLERRTRIASTALRTVLSALPTGCNGRASQAVGYEAEPRNQARGLQAQAGNHWGNIPSIDWFSHSTKERESEQKLLTVTSSGLEKG